jgi:hypothetical protein
MKGKYVKMETFKGQRVMSGPEITEQRSEIWSRRKQRISSAQVALCERGVRKSRRAGKETGRYGEKRTKTKL